GRGQRLRPRRGQRRQRRKRPPANAPPDERQQNPPPPRLAEELERRVQAPRSRQDHRRGPRGKRQARRRHRQPDVPQSRRRRHVEIDCNAFPALWFDPFPIIPMTTKYALLLVLAGILPAFAKDPVDYVDPFIGTGARGKTFPGAATPGGMI